MKNVKNKKIALTFCEKLFIKQLLGYNMHVRYLGGIF